MQLINLFHLLLAELQANPQLGQYEVDARILAWDKESQIVGLNLATN